MAVRYPIIPGNWSNPLIWNGGTLPTAADDVYANNQTVTIDIDVTVLSIRNTAQSPAIANGTFILNGGITVTAQLFAGPATLITYTSNSTSRIIGSLRDGTTATSTCVLFNSVSGTLNITGSVLKSGSSNAPPLRVNNTGTVNIVGDVYNPSSSAEFITISIAAAAIVNITGNVSSNAATAIFANSMITTISGCRLNITGNLTYNSNNATAGRLIDIVANAIVNITGNVLAGDFGTYAILHNAAGYLNVIGSISSKPATLAAAIVSNSYSAINIFSGPFVCSTLGAMPIYVVKMYYRITIGSYFEFRDSSTNGIGAAPATRLVAPATAADAPIPSNVRQGVVYAFGTSTGTLAVPSPGSVALGVPTDNTVGTAVLTPDAIWDYATASITDVDSIGARLKNVSTVETTGSQLAAFLNG